MPPVKPPRLKDAGYWIKLELDRSEHHGLELASDVNNGLVICDIRKTSAARDDGRLEIGDVILQINDVSVQNESADFARQLLESFCCSSGSVCLKVQRHGQISHRQQGQATHTLNTEACRRRGHPSPVISDTDTEGSAPKSMKTTEYVENWAKVHSIHNQLDKEGKCSIVHLVQDQQSGVGIDLREVEVMGNPKHQKYVIDRVREGSPAARDGRLRVGQSVLAINGKLLTACDRMEISELLNEKIVQLAVESGDRIDLSELPPPISPDDIWLLPPFCEDHVTDVAESHVMGSQEFTDLTEVGDSENNYISVVLRKKAKGKGLGFSVVGGVDTPQGAMGIHIKTLYSNGLAAECGLLRPGDEIMSVNGQSLDGLRHQQAVDLFKGLKRGTVVIRAKKRLYRTRPPCEEENHLSENKLPVHLQNDKRSVWTDEGVLLQEIKLYKDPVLGLGFDVTSTTQSGLLRIEKIAKGSSADLCKRIRLGDELLKINNLQIKNYKGERAVQLLGNIPAGPVSLKTRRATETQTPKEADDSLDAEPPGGYIQQLSGSLLLENYLNSAQQHENGVVNPALDVSQCSTGTPDNLTENHVSPNDLDLPTDPHFDPSVILPLPEEFRDVTNSNEETPSECDSVTTSHSKSSRSRLTSPNHRCKSRAQHNVVDLEDIVIEFDPKKEEKWMQKLQEEKAELAQGSRCGTKSTPQVVAECMQNQGGGKEDRMSDHTGISASLIAAAATTVALSRVSKVNGKTSNHGDCVRRAEGVGHRGLINGMLGDNNNCNQGIDKRPARDSCSTDRATGGEVSLHTSCEDNTPISAGGEEGGSTPSHGRPTQVTAGVTKQPETGEKVNSGQNRVSSGGRRALHAKDSLVEYSFRDTREGTDHKVNQKECITNKKDNLSDSGNEKDNKNSCNHISSEQIHSEPVGKDMANRKTRNVGFLQEEDTDSNDGFKIRRKRTRQEKIEILVIQRLPGEKLGMGINIESKGDESDYIRGVYVENVSPGGAADKAVGGNHGVCLGDEILEINGVLLQQATYQETVNFFKELPLRIILKIKRRPLALRLASQKKRDASRQSSMKDADSSTSHSEINSDVSDSSGKDKTEGTSELGESDIVQYQTQGHMCLADVHNEQMLSKSLLTQIPRIIDGTSHTAPPLEECDSFPGPLLKDNLHNSSYTANEQLSSGLQPRTLHPNDSSSGSDTNSDLSENTIQATRISGPSEKRQYADDTDKRESDFRHVNELTVSNCDETETVGFSISNSHGREGCDPGSDRSAYQGYQVVEVTCQALEEASLVELSQNTHLNLCKVDYISPSSSWDDVIHLGDFLIRFEKKSLEGLSPSQVKLVICGGGGDSDVTISVFRRLNQTPENDYEDKKCAEVSNGSVNCGKEVLGCGFKPEKNTRITLHDSIGPQQEAEFRKKEDIKPNSEPLFQEKRHEYEERIGCVAGGVNLSNQRLSNPSLTELNHLFAQSHGRLALEKRSFRCTKCRQDSIGHSQTRTSKSEPTSPRKCQCLVHPTHRSLSRDFSHLLSDPLSSVWSDQCHCQATGEFGGSDLAHVCPVTLESGYCSLDKHRQGLVCEALHSVHLDKQGELAALCDVTSDIISPEYRGRCVVGDLTSRYPSHVMDTQEVPPLPTSGPPGSSPGPLMDPPPLPGSMPPPLSFTGLSKEEPEALDIDDYILSCDSDQEAVSHSDFQEADDIEGLSIFSNTESATEEYMSDEMGDNSSNVDKHEEEIPAPVITPHVVPEHVDKEALFENYTKAINNMDSLLNLSHDYSYKDENNHYADDVTVLSGSNPSVSSQERPEPLGGYDKSQSLETDCYPTKPSDAIGSQQTPVQANQPITDESHITNHSERYVSPLPNLPHGSSSVSSNSTAMDANGQDLQNQNSELELCTRELECNYTEPLLTQPQSLQPTDRLEIDSSLQAAPQPEHSTREEADNTTVTPGDCRADKTTQHSLPPGGQQPGQNEQHTTQSNAVNNSSDVSDCIHAIAEEVRENSCSSSGGGVNNELLQNIGHTSGDGSSCRNSKSESTDESDEQLVDVIRDQDEPLREDMYNRSAVSSLMSDTPGVAGSGKAHGQDGLVTGDHGTIVTGQPFVDDSLDKGLSWGESYGGERENNEVSGSNCGSFVKQDGFTAATLQQEHSSATLINAIHQGGSDLQSTASAECHSTEINPRVIQHGFSREERVVNGKSEKCAEYYSSQRGQLACPGGNTSPQRPALLDPASESSTSLTETAIYDSVEGRDKAQTDSHGYVPQSVTNDNGMCTKDSFIAATSSSQGVEGVPGTRYNKHTESRKQSSKPVVTRKKSDSGEKPPLPPKPKHLALSTAAKGTSKPVSKQGGVSDVQGQDNSAVKGRSLQSPGLTQTINSPVVRDETAVDGTEPLPHQYQETDQSALRELPSQGSLDLPLSPQRLGNQSEECDDVDMLSRRVLLARSASSSSSGDGRGTGESISPQPRPQMLLSAPRRVAGKEDSEADDISHSSCKQPLGEPWGVKLKSYTGSTGPTEEPMLPTGPHHTDSDVISRVKLLAEIEKTFGGLGAEINVTDNTAVITSVKTSGNLGKLRVGDIVLGVNGKPLSGLNNIRVQQLLRLLPTGPVRLDILRERNQQATTASFEVSASISQKVIKSPLVSSLDYVERNQPTPQRYQDKRIPPKTKDKPKVLPKSLTSRSNDPAEKQIDTNPQHGSNDLDNRDAVGSIAECQSVSESVTSPDSSEYKLCPRTPPDGTDHPDEASHSRLDDLSKPSATETKPPTVADETLKYLTDSKTLSDREPGVISNSSQQPSFGVVIQTKGDSENSLNAKLSCRETKPNFEETAKSVDNRTEEAASKILKPLSSPSANLLPNTEVNQTADPLQASPLEVVAEEVDMEVENSPREDDIQGVPRTSRSGSLRSANRESIIESLERKRRESTGTRLKGLQLPSGIKKPAASGNAVTELPSLFKPVPTQGLLPKPKERRSSYTSMMPTSPWTKETSALNGPTPFKVSISSESSKPMKSAGVFKVPAPVTKDSSLAPKKTITSMSRSYSEDVLRSNGHDLSIHKPSGFSDTPAVTNHHSVSTSNITDSSANKDTFHGTSQTLSEKDRHAGKDGKVLTSESTVITSQKTETFGMPPVVNMNTFPPAINSERLPSSPPREQPPPPPPSDPPASQPVHRQLSLEIETIAEAPRHTIQLSSVKSPISKTFASPRSAEFSPNNKDTNLNDSLLTAGSSMQSLDTTDTDSLPCSSSPKKGDGFVPPSSPLGVSKEDISEGRGSLVSTPDLDLDAPRSPTLSESDSGIFSAKLELKKDIQIGEKHKSAVDPAPRSRTSASSLLSSTSFYNSTESPKTRETSKSPESARTQQTSSYRSSQTPPTNTQTAIPHSPPTENSNKSDDPKTDRLTSKDSPDNNRSSSYKSWRTHSSSSTGDSLGSTQTNNTTSTSDDVFKVSRPERLSTSSYKSSSFEASSNDISPRTATALTPRSERIASRSPTALTPRSERIRSFETSTNQISPRTTSTSEVSPRSPNALTPRSERVRSTTELSPRSSSSTDVSPRSTSALTARSERLRSYEQSRNELSPRTETTSELSTKHTSPRSTTSSDDLSPRSASANQLSPKSTVSNELSPRSTSSEVSSKDEEEPTAEGVDADVAPARGVMEVEMVKGAIGLGFCIEGGMGSPRGDLPVLVKRLFKGSSAAKGKLQAGDEIMKVNGKDISNMSHYLAWNHLKSLPEGTITMTICRK